MRFAIKRGLVIALGVLLQIAVSYLGYMFLINNIYWVKIFYTFIALILTLLLIKDSKNYAYTLPWIIILILFPISGAVLYIVLGKNKLKSKTLKNILKNDKESKKYYIPNNEIVNEINNNTRLKYICDYAKYPVTCNNETEYYPIGESGFEAMVKELKKAENFIFFEYFIVKPGKMWDTILEILTQKVKDGVEVRVMYDDMGCIGTLKSSYPKKLEGLGIKCVVFNHLNPLAGVIMNNRDHRKILIIDGKVAFSGGINISDEYINIGSKYGHWKDNAIKIKGDAVWNYTVMFLSMWNSFKNEDEDYEKYKYNFEKKSSNKEYVVPYGETPLDNELTGEDIYLNIINQSNEYVYIMTPYLIIDTDVINTLCLAAKRGVDVRIVIPGIPDKKIVYTLSESYIGILARAGVKIYKYKPGFVHSKVFVADDKMATVGTINLDYRSLYLHFECGCYFENGKIIEKVKSDVVDTIGKSELILKKDIHPNIIKGMFQALLRIVAPLM